MEVTAVTQKIGTEAVASQDGIKSMKFSAGRLIWLCEKVTSGHCNLLISNKNISIPTTPKAAHNNQENFFVMPQ